MEVIIREDWGKQAKFEWRSRCQALDDLPRAEIFFVGVKSGQIEIQLVGVNLGEEIAAASKIFQIEKFTFFEAMHGFHIALVGMRGRWDAYVLAVAERGGKLAFEFATVVGLPD
jgi:hypothetical protein